MARDRPPGHTRWVEVLVLLAVPLWIGQALIGVRWGPLTTLQSHPGWRLGSGLAVGVVIAWLWVQSQARSTSRPSFWLALHRIGGLVGVGVLFLHTTRFGHGYLGPLAAAFLGTVVVGAVSPAALRLRSVRLHQLWLFVHIGFALVLLAGVAFHVWIGLGYV